MNELVTRCLEEKDTKWLAEVPKEIMTATEAEIVDFVLDYNRKHGEAPSVKRLMEEFEIYIPFKFTPSRWEDEAPPIGDVFEQTIKRKLVVASEQILADVHATISREGYVPLEDIREIDRIHTMSTGVHAFSSFDRGLYFRRKTMDVPFKLINDNIGGLGPGDSMLLIGRLGTGKSTIAQHFALYAWERAMKVLFVSVEMLATDVFGRIDAMLGKFNPLLLRTGSREDIEYTLKAIERRAASGKGEIIIPKTRLISPASIGSFAQNLGIQLIIVDGAYLLEPDGGGYKAKWERVAAVSNQLKQLSIDLEVPIISTSQIKRGASGSAGYDPEDIAYSDALGQDADFIIAGYPNETIKNRIELQLIKNRYGDNCATQIYIDWENMTITDETVEGAVGPGSEKVKASEWKA